PDPGAARCGAGHLHAGGPSGARGGGRSAGSRPRGQRLLRSSKARMTLLNAALQGVFLGAFSSVLACGLSIMFGVMRIINLAHGDIAVLGAYVVFFIVEHTGVSAFVAFAVALPVMILLGYVLQLTVLERSLKAGILTPLLATFGLSIVIQNLLQLTFSPDVHSLGSSAGLITTSSWQVTSGLSVSALGMVILVVAVVVFGALQLFLSRTRAGWMMRA